MNEKDLKETIEALQALSKEMASSKEKALAFLVEGGFVTPDGELTEHYRQGA